MEQGNKEQWLTVNEALAEFKITSRTTLYKYLKMHKIRVSKPVGKLYINQEDVVQTLSGNAIPMGI